MRQRRHPERQQSKGARARVCLLYRGLLRDQSASVLPIVALCGLVLVGVTGLALDGARMAIMSSRLQASVDAAGLSAGARVSTEEFEAEVDRFTRANFNDGYIGAAITSIDARPGSDEETFIVSASAQASTIFMRIFGIDNFDVSAEAEITRAMGGLELALVLDVTGSMKGAPLASLKTASNDLLNILFGEEATVDDLYVGIVPFAPAVNIGKSRQNWLTTEHDTTLTRKQKDDILARWNGCVEERYNGLDQNDVAPVGLDPVNDRPSSQYFAPIVNGSSICPAELTPMTSAKAKLVTAISNLKADGGTHVNVGAVWGWRMLSPEWRGLWGGGTLDTLPLDYQSGATSKAAVIMTDGKNEFSPGNSYGTPARGSCKRYSWIFCAEYNLVFDERIGAASSYTEASAALDDKLEAVCVSMKNAGVTVYTVVFGDIGANAENRLKECASQPAFYFNSPNGAALQTAFAKIGDSLSALRVSR